MSGLSGGCQCGAVRFRTHRADLVAHICHCRMCQKAVGNVFAGLVDVGKSELTWTRGAPAVFLSSADVGRGFCRDCGTPLFYGYEGGFGLCLGAFDTPAALPLDRESGMEGRWAQLDQLGKVPDLGETEIEMGQEAAYIASTNRQHPDHDTDDWPPR